MDCLDIAELAEIKECKIFHVQNITRDPNMLVNSLLVVVVDTQCDAFCGTEENTFFSRK